MVVLTARSGRRRKDSPGRPMNWVNTIKGQELDLLSRSISNLNRRTIGVEHNGFALSRSADPV